MSTNLKEHHSAVARAAGRPSLTEQDIERRREDILQATAGVYAQLDYRTLTVEHILAASGISRPTFYSVFKNKDAVLELLVAKANEELIVGVYRALVSDDDPAVQLENALRAYIDWGCSKGAVVKAIYRESRIPGSPAYEPRNNIFQALCALLQSEAEKAGYQPAKALVHACCVGIEHLGAELFGKASIRARDRNATLSHMMTMVGILFTQPVPRAA